MNARAGRVVMILQARMGSTRLPGKSMLDLAGAPLVGRILERVRRCRRLDAIVLATTTKPEDDCLATLARDHDVAAFRGAEHDLVDRYYQAARTHGARVIVRLPGDNPVAEPSEIDRIIEYHVTGAADFSSNLSQINGSGYPDGIGAEVFNVDLLEAVWRRATEPEKREHVHLSFFDYRSQQATGRYRIGTVPCPPEFSRPDLVLDVNTPADYDFMAALYSYLYPRNSRFHVTDIIQWYDDICRPGAAACNGKRQGREPSP